MTPEKNNQMLQAILDTVVEIKNNVKQNKKEIKKNGTKIDRLTESLMYVLERRVDKLEIKTAAI